MAQSPRRIEDAEAELDAANLLTAQLRETQAQLFQLVGQTVDLTSGINNRLTTVQNMLVDLTSGINNRLTIVQKLLARETAKKE